MLGLALEQIGSEHRGRYSNGQHDDVHCSDHGLVEFQGMFKSQTVVKNRFRFLTIFPAKPREKRNRFFDVRGDKHPF
jgi:hypothetical protein